MARKIRGRRRRDYRSVIIIAILAIVLVLLVGGLAWVLVSRNQNGGQQTTTTSTAAEAESTQDPSVSGTYGTQIATARVMASQYDYDGAIDYLKAQVPDYENQMEVLDVITEFEAEKDNLVKWADNTQITHIFFHSLIVDVERAFSSSKSEDYNEVMTTVEEFNKIMNSMYDRGYVLVNLDDICKMETSADGTQHMVMQDIYLPAGKKPFVLSVDDVCYYEYMDGHGFATKLLIGEDGRVTNEYIEADGTVVYGSYDVMTILEDFLVEHPDFCYKGARGILALTGYNGILGYRTSDITYGPGNTTWPSAHEWDNENIEADKQTAMKVAEAIKAQGWSFASHSWGHMQMGSADDERFYRDTDWWETEVESLVGPVDILIFPFGQDIGTWRGYDDTNARFMYLKEKGFNYFCNVDSSTHAWVQSNSSAGGSGYFRQGRRNLDGLLMYKAILYPEDNILSDLFDALEVFDRARPLPVRGVTIPEGSDGSLPTSSATSTTTETSEAASQ